MFLIFILCRRRSSPSGHTSHHPFPSSARKFLQHLFEGEAVAGRLLQRRPACFFTPTAASAAPHPIFCKKEKLPKYRGLPSALPSSAQERLDHLSEKKTVDSFSSKQLHHLLLPARQRLLQLLSIFILYGRRSFKKAEGSHQLPPFWRQELPTPLLQKSLRQLGRGAEKELFFFIITCQLAIKVCCISHHPLEEQGKPSPYKKKQLVDFTGAAKQKQNRT
jgi:hypothetical protein